MTNRRPPDPSANEPTMMPDDIDGLEPPTTRDPTLEVSRVPVRPKPKRPQKKGAGPLAWVLVILLLGGIGAAVTVVIMQGQNAEPAAADASSAPAADAGAAAADDAGAAADAAADATEEVAEEVAPDAAEEVAEEVAPDAAEEVAEEVADDVIDEVSEADAVAVDDAVAAAVEDAVAPVDDAGVAAVADAGTTETTADAAVAADGTAADVVAAPKPPNPAEAKRLNESGFALRKAGDHAGAMNAYKAAVAADPENVWAHYNYACELALAGQQKPALDELVLIYKLGTTEAKKALAAARKDADFASLRDLGQFQRLTR